jgi:hypothetical protein
MSFLLAQCSGQQWYTIKHCSTGNGHGYKSVSEEIMDSANGIRYSLSFTFDVHRDSIHFVFRLRKEQPIHRLIIPAKIPAVSPPD